MTDTLTLRSARPVAVVARAAAAPILLAALIAACSTAAAPSPTPGATGSPSAPPTAAPTSTPEIDGIQHPTGATDVVLRMEEGGGFVPIDFLATSAPQFTLYGDGTVVFRDPTATLPEPVGGVTRSAPFLIVNIGEGGIQALLTEAIGPGGLGAAVGPYMGQGADMSTTTFTINADGDTKQVSVSGFLPDLHPQDAVIVGALGRLAERLSGFADAIAGEAKYVPAAYRGILMPVDQPFGPVIAWPWTDITPAEFVPGDNEFFMTRTMTLAEVAVLEIPGAEGGFLGLTLKHEGKLFSFSLRPLLPDETK
jgi:hypothetical protein